MASSIRSHYLPGCSLPSPHAMLATCAWRERALLSSLWPLIWFCFIQSGIRSQNVLMEICALVIISSLVGENTFFKELSMDLKRVGDVFRQPPGIYEIEIPPRGMFYFHDMTPPLFHGKEIRHPSQHVGYRAALVNKLDQKTGGIKNTPPTAQSHLGPL